ncbi:probable membrane-associated kinase regulator 2 isoform X1 [Olea europaea var. sylvestris]|uniref:probable membrane-associated kinase regulator 2 isoform X1 n=1 Tax=Olea europaea var. sylvestris TaxID=158386 RepID=UPI000C1D5A22|nr:probable membrane-associated kinase regulator 2 isoform X1 [Olea europaea var. sylvestris]
MEFLTKLKIWANSVAGADVSSDGDCFTNSSENSNDEKTDDEDSFFDLVFQSPDSNSKPLSPVALQKTAPKFKPFMLGSKKSSICDKTEINREQTKRDSVNCKVDEGRVSSDFTRDKSLRSKLLQDICDESSINPSSKQSLKDCVPKYLKLFKPLHIKVSKRKNWIMNFSDSVTPTSSPAAPTVNLSPFKFSYESRVGSFGSNRLTKSRSTSTAAVNRRDDSLLQQHDGIQGAILHCKKSFDSSYKEFSQLPRSYSSHEKLIQPRRNSCEERKRCSI